jgi:phage shock protein A
MIAVFILWRTNNDCQKQLVLQREGFEKTLTEMFNARLSEMKVATTTAERVLQVLEGFKTTVESRNQAFDRVKDLLERMATSQDASRERFKEQADRMEKGINALNNVIRPRPAMRIVSSGDGDGGGTE